jgi:hypothetical protein
MRIGFILVILCILAFAIGRNWRLIKGGIDKIIFIGLTLLNIGIFLVYVQQKKLSFPLHGMFNQFVHYTLAILGVKDHG